MNDITRFAAIGECLIEMRHRSATTLDMAFAGDTCNVAIYLARFQKNIRTQVAYVTAIGDDPYSDMMLDFWQQEHLACEFVQRLPGKMPGLYFIRTDPQGERHFYYYREQSAARQMFATKEIKEITNQLLRYDYLYFSGITLAILDSASREHLLDLMQQARSRGACIVFDTNYRARLWPNISLAQAVISQALQYVDIALPSFDDEQALFGDASLAACVERFHRHGIKEVVVKQGKQGVWLSTATTSKSIPVQEAVSVIDSTAAGDSFNAGYLAGHILKLAPEQAVACGMKLAARVVSYPGAIIPLQAMPQLFFTDL